MPDGTHPGPPHPPPRWSPAQPPSPCSALSSSTRPFRPEDPAPRTPQSALSAGRLPPPYRPTPPRPAAPPRDGILDCTYVTACNLTGQMKTLGLLREITTQQRSILPTVLHTALSMSYSGSRHSRR